MQAEDKGMPRAFAHNFLEELLGTVELEYHSVFLWPVAPLQSVLFILCRLMHTPSCMFPLLESICFLLRGLGIPRRAC